MEMLKPKMAKLGVLVFLFGAFLAACSTAPVPVEPCETCDVCEACEVCEEAPVCPDVVDLCEKWGEIPITEKQLDFLLGEQELHSLAIAIDDHNLRWVETCE